jgi:transcriptional regulator with GAF, ATPase, and Fis domain
MKPQAFEELIDIGSLIEQRQTLEEGLSELAKLTAESLAVARCSVMLMTACDAEQRAPLRVCSHYGNLPLDAYQTEVEADDTIAGHVAACGEPLLINDLQRSPLAHLARQDPRAEGSFMSAPIRIADKVVGVINVSQPSNASQGFTSQELEQLIIFARFVGKSIHVFQLKRLAESRLLQMAEILEQRDEHASAAKQISPDPRRLAKIVAKSFYRELALAGFGPSAIIAVATEVLGLLNTNLAKHRERIARNN